jgi:site-specific DNA recombinase
MTQTSCATTKVSALLLINEGTFNAVQEIQRRNQEEAARNLREPEALLLRNGFAKCGYCGKNMSAQWSKSNKRYRYLCGNMNGIKPCPGKRFFWNAAYLDDVAWRWFVFQFENPEVIRAKHEIWKADRVEGRTIEHDRLGAIDKALKEATRRRKNYLANSGGADSETERLEYAGLAHEEYKAMQSLAKEHEALTAILARDEQQEAAVGMLVSLGAQAREALKHFDFDSKRRALYALKVTITCWSQSHPDKWIIRWGLSEMQTRALEFLGVDTSIYAQGHCWPSPPSPSSPKG